MNESKGQPRAKYLRMGQSRVGEGTPDNDSQPAFTITRGELVVMVRAAASLAVREALEASQAPALLDREALAGQLGCSSSLVDKLRRQGMPHVRLGDSPRFELEACLGWIRKDGAA